jgi:hypothetical protein
MCRDWILAMILIELVVASQGRAETSNSEAAK